MSIPRIKSHFKVFSFSQIIWQKQCEGEVGSNCLVTVDGTDFEIVQSKPVPKISYEYNHNDPGVRYEITVSYIGGDIIWINRLYKSSC